MLFRSTITKSKHHTSSHSVWNVISKEGGKSNFKLILGIFASNESFESRQKATQNRNHCLIKVVDFKFLIWVCIKQEALYGKPTVPTVIHRRFIKFLSNFFYRALSSAASVPPKLSHSSSVSTHWSVSAHLRKLDII